MADFDPDAYLEAAPEQTQSAPQEAPRSESAFDPDAYLSKPFDPDAYLGDGGEEKPQAEGALGTFARSAAHSVAPTLGALPAMAAGAELGAGLGAFGGPAAPFTVPAGALVGGVIGAAGGSYLVSKAQDWVLAALGLDDSAQRQSNEEANPVSSFAGDVAPAVAAFSPGQLAKSFAQRAVGAGVMGGIELGQEAAQGDVSPGKVLGSAAVGAVLNKPTKLGESLMAPGQRAGAQVAAKFRPGRPDQSPTPTMDQEKADASSSVAPNTTIGAAEVKQPPSENVTTLGNPGSAPGRDGGNDGRYAKQNTPSQGGSGVSTGEFDPNTLAAIRGAFQQETPPAQQVPNAPKPITKRQQIDMSGIPEQQRPPEEPIPKPVETGLAEQPAPQPTPPQSQEQAAAAPVHTGLSDATAADTKHPHLPDVNIDRSKGVPGLAGTNADASVVYIDPSMPREIDVNGKVIDPANSLAVHEVYERHGINAITREIAAGRLPKMSPEQIYTMAHEKVGNGAEQSYLQEHFGFNDADWQRYQEIMKEHYTRTGDKPGGELPKDLFTYGQTPEKSAPPAVKAADDTITSEQVTKHVAARLEQTDIAAAAAKTKMNPTEAQKKSGKYPKGKAEVIPGVKVAIENPKGTRREGVGPDGKPWSVEMPQHYGEIEGTRGADGDKVDAFVGDGDRHFVIDQQDPATKKFDEHKVMLNQRDGKSALDAYVRAHDEDGIQRVQAIKEMKADELKQWLSDRKATKVPVAEAEITPSVTPAKPGRKMNTLSLGEENPVTAAVTKPRPESVQKAIDDAKARGMDAIAAKLEKAAPGEAVLLARNVRRKLGTVSVPAKVEGTDVTARSKEDAERKGNALRAAQEAFDKFPPKENETPDELRTRLHQILDHADAAQANGGKDPVKAYPKREKPPGMQLLQAARKYLSTRNPAKADEKLRDFQATEGDLRAGNVKEAQAVKRADADRERRSGPSIELAEANHAVLNPHEVEDALIESIDEQRRGEFPGETPHEEAESMVAPEPVTAAQIKQAEQKTSKTLDLKTMSPEELDKIADSFIGEPGAEVTPKWKAEEEARAKATTDKTAALRAAREARKAAEAQKTLGSMLKDEGGGGPLPSLPHIDHVAAADARPQTYIAKKSMGPADDYARSLDERLHTLGQQMVEHKQALLQESKSWPKEVRTPEAQDKIYQARESGNTNGLPAELKDFYDTKLKPIFDQTDKFFDNIQAIWPGLLGPKVKDHIYRISRGYQPERDMFSPGASADPIEGAHNMPVGKKGTMNDRVFMALEGDNGKRAVISADDDGNGFTLWDHYKANKITAPGFDVSVGSSFKASDGTVYTVKDALTPEIEKHAEFWNGKPARYYHDATLSALMANQQLAGTAHYLQFLHNLKQDPDFLKFATRDADTARANGWKETENPQFNKTHERWFMDDRLRQVLDDYAQPGFNTDSLNWLRKLSQGVTKLLFWMPTAHAANVGAHWFVERGWDWITPSGYRSLAVDGVRAVKSVINQDEIQKELLKRGSGIILPGILTKDFMQQVGKTAGLAMEKNPAKWDPIARVLGMGPSDLISAIYRGSSKAMWGASDMFMTQAVLANQRKGMPLEQAIKMAERHIPNYRIPTRVMTSEKGGRFLSQIMQDQAFLSFGRYHYGVFNSYAHVVKDLTSGDKNRTAEAVGNLMALGILAFAVKPVLDKMAQIVSGNKDAEEFPRGPLTIPTHIVKALQGKEDVTSAARGALTMSPMASTALETLSNKDFAGRPIVEPATVAHAARGNPKAMGRAAIQEGEHLARGLVSPYGTFANAAKAGHNPLETVRDTALDIKNPSPNAVRYSQKLPATSVQKEKTRFTHPPGFAEGLYNRMLGF